MKDTRLEIEQDLSRTKEWPQVKTLQVFVLKLLKAKMNLTLPEFKDVLTKKLADDCQWLQ
jgi:hypothetical protein